MHFRHLYCKNVSLAFFRTILRRLRAINHKIESLFSAISDSIRYKPISRNRESQNPVTNLTSTINFAMKTVRDRRLFLFSLSFTINPEKLRKLARHIAPINHDLLSVSLNSFCMTFFCRLFMKIEKN